MEEIVRKSGINYFDPENTLLLSVRSGAVISMPGTMRTILNVGMNDKTARILDKTKKGGVKVNKKSNPKKNKSVKNVLEITLNIKATNLLFKNTLDVKPVMQYLLILIYIFLLINLLLLIFRYAKLFYV